MNVRGERILVFGDSLTHHGADSAPEAWNVDQGPNRPSSTPGDILASLFTVQNAQAVRTDARVGRSAVNFYERENAQALLDADVSWRPTKVVIMLGTNDIGRDVGKETAAFQALKSTFENAGAEVWAVGPFTYNDQSLNAQAPAIVQVMQGVFGHRFIDGRPLSVQTGRTSDGVHFASQDAAMRTALNIANALMSTSSPGDLAGALILGGLIAFGAYKLFEAFTHRPQQQLYGEARDGFAHRGPPFVHEQPKPRGILAGLLAAPVDDDIEDDGIDDLDELDKRHRRAKAERTRLVKHAFGESNAIILTLRDGQQKLAIKSPEMSSHGEGKLRVTYFGHDGPIGHATRKSMTEIVNDVIDYFPVAVKPASEAEVMRWTSTEEFARGAEQVAAVQRANAGLKGAKKRRRKRTA